MIITSKRIGIFLTIMLLVVVMAMAGCSSEQPASANDGPLTKVDGVYYYTKEDGSYLKGDFYLEPQKEGSSIQNLYYFSKDEGKGIKFVVKAVSDHITAIIEPSTTIIYIVEGTEQSLIIDSGTGVGDFVKMIEMFTDKPYVMWQTHVHGDHTGGSYVVDCDVYLNERDWSGRSGGGVSMRLSYNREQGLMMLNENDMTAYKDLDYKPLNEGDSIDLGGYTVRAFELPGHTLGSMVFLCEQDKILITGDAANPTTRLSAISVEEYGAALRELKEALAPYESDIVNIMVSHGVGTTAKFNPTLLDDLIVLCDEIVEKGYSEGEVALDEATGQYRTTGSDKDGHIYYSKGNIYAEDGE